LIFVKQVNDMHPQFSDLTPRWFKRAFVYTGSIGDFRYRYATDKDKNEISVSVYTVYCFEVAQDVKTEVFSWDDTGVEALKQWVDQEYQLFQKEHRL